MTGVQTCALPIYYKDDKSYPYIAITRGDVFPAIKYTREKHRPDTRYYLSLIHI